MSLVLLQTNLDHSLIMALVTMYLLIQRRIWFICFNIEKRRQTWNNAWKTDVCLLPIVKLANWIQSIQLLDQFVRLPFKYFKRTKAAIEKYRMEFFWYTCKAHSCMLTFTLDVMSVDFLYQTRYGWWFLDHLKLLQLWGLVGWIVCQMPLPATDLITGTSLQNKKV